jgi:SAM-dependent methyltransferase
MPDPRCIICGHTALKLFKPSDIPACGLSAASLAISDAHYGKTGEIRACPRCGFRQVVDIPETLALYEQLDDPGFLASEQQRALQARALLRQLQKHKPQGTLLDIGAASGILVEEAAKLGYAAQGIEPSHILQAAALRKGRDVRLGTFPHPELTEPYDCITLVDVIEHVNDPLTLIGNIANALKPDGVGYLTTPDSGSLAARLMGWRWWHYRMAHIGYFNRKNLCHALDKAGLEPLSITRPRWYFECAYLWERATTYLPAPLRIPLPKPLATRLVPANFFDSLAVVFRRR